MKNRYAGEDPKTDEEHRASEEPRVIKQLDVKEIGKAEMYREYGHTGIRNRR